MVDGWRRFDLFCFLPISGITTSASNFVTLAVVIDRVIYMKTCLPKGIPKYCQPTVAKKVVSVIICVCVFCNLPYFFIYQEVDGRLVTSAFFESIWYSIYNWIKFFILVLSSAILIGTNAKMICIMRKWYKRSYLLRCGNSMSEKKQLFSQTQLTLTIIVVVFLFLIGEIPMYLASRRSAITMLFQGDLSKSSSQALETFRIIATFLHALHISLNIAIYTSLNPPYIIELFDFLQIICSKCHWKVFSNNTGGNTSNKIISNSFETNICIIHGVSVDESSMSKKSITVNSARTSNYRICTCPSTATKKETIEIENNDYVEILAS
ncbi:uncharacterized protein LOC119071773 isoform X2 [Bradysia coprophila]|uniref:uncharacterized protein LOC119071773 isoform X2 n=1 Tax=Bradysia coprophila TaxID=38358 RepID=UPI00187D8B55|nr:uncharacterized protein LOC119071773 isoform X2 [Bradysia coprophila]